MGDVVVYYIKTITGQTTTYKGVAELEPLQTFVEQWTKSNREEYRLIFAGVLVTCKEDLPATESCIHFVRNLRGGGSTISSRTDFEKGKTKTPIGKAGASSPKWTIVDVGVNVLCECKNKRCPTHAGLFFHPLGLGVFDLLQKQEPDQFLCRGCFDRTSDFVTLYFVGSCEYTIEATSTATTQKSIKTRGSVASGMGEKFEYDANDDKMSTWKSLIVKAYLPIIPVLDASKT